MKIIKSLFVPVLAVAAIAGVWFSLGQSTRRYLIHLGKQLPSLPYRYFV